MWNAAKKNESNITRTHFTLSCTHTLEHSQNEIFAQLLLCQILFSGLEIYARTNGHAWPCSVCIIAKKIRTNKNWSGNVA